MRVVCVALGCTALLIVSACARQPVPPSVQKVYEPPYPVIAASYAPLPQEQRLDGVVEAVDQATISAQTAGRVSRIHYDANDAIAAGAVVLELHATEQDASVRQAQAALQEARARALESVSHYRRIADLQARKVVPRATLDEAIANRDAAQAQQSAARAGLLRARESRAYTQVRAPFAGIVSRRLVEVGETVAPGTALFSLVSTQALRVAFDLPQRLATLARAGATTLVYAEEQRITPTQLTVFDVAAAQAGTVHARAYLPHTVTGLYPGQTVKVGIQTGAAQTLAVPRTTLIERGEMTALYVFDPATGSTRLRQLRLGHRYGDAIEVLAGLSAGERVALDPHAAARFIVPAHSSVP